jgi:hypothetical protein
MDEAVLKVFEKGPIKDLAPVCDLVLKIPSIFKSMLEDRIKKTHPAAYQGDNLKKEGL